MEAISNAVEPYRKSWAYAPIGIILGAIPWIVLIKITEKISILDAAHLRKTLLALIFTAAYVYTWSQGSNPHDVEIKANIFADELFLFLAGGYYLLFTKQQSLRHVTHDFLFIVLIIAVIINGEVAASANTYGFLVNAPTVFLMLSRFVQKLHFKSVSGALNYLSIIVYFFSNVNLCVLGRLIISNEQVPVHIRIVFFFLLIFEFLNIVEDVCGLMFGEEERNTVKNKESKSITRSLCFKKEKWSLSLKKSTCKW